MVGKKTREISPEQQIAFLRKIHFFRGFSEKDLRQFLLVSRWLKVPAETLVIKEGSTERVFYILVKGEVSVFKQVENESIELTRLVTGDCFGEMSLVMDVKRTAGVRTTSSSYLLMVEPEIINTSSTALQLKFYKRFCEILVGRLIMANRKMIGEMESPEENKEQKLESLLPSAPEEKRIVAHQEPIRMVDPAILPPLPKEEEKRGKLRVRKQVIADRILPINSQIAHQLEMFLHSKEGTVNTRRMVDLISSDPVLSLKVLQVANSSFYRRSSAVISVSHALIALGIDLIHEVVSDYLGLERDRKYFSGLKEVYLQFWRHSVVVGRIAERLQDAIRVQTPLDLYMAGLLHDFGILALDPIAPTFYAQTLRPDSEIQKQLVQAELKYIGIDHGLAGALFGDKIGLPEPYVKVMQFHHEPQLAREYLVAVALVSLADIFAARHGACMGEPSPEKIDPLDSFAWIMLQDQHKPFMEVNVVEFVTLFDEELKQAWNTIDPMPDSSEEGGH